MAEQALNFVTSVATSELTSRVFSALIQRYGKDATAREKLERLELLLIKIHSTIEASEKRTIKNTWLLRWNDKLIEAASQGDNVVAIFLQREKDAQGTSNTDANQQQGEATSSSAAAPATHVGALSFTRNSLSGMVQGICNARDILFSSADDDMERLSRTLGSLEKLSPDIGEFIRLLHLEALSKVDQTPCNTGPSTKAHGPMEKMGETSEKKRIEHSATHSNPTPEPPVKEEKRELPPPKRFCSFLSLKSHVIPVEVLQKRRQFRLLEAAFTEICKAVELANNHDLEGLEWLAYWADILREAKEQGRDFLGTTNACKNFSLEGKRATAVGCDQQEDDLSTMLHRLEGLARDVEYFSKLVDLSSVR